MKKFINVAVALIVSVISAAIVGCSCGNLKVSNFFYDNEKDYSIGDFTYSPSDISEIEINWIAGDIEILSAEDESLSVSESGKNLEENQKLRYLIRDGKLTVQYWKSGYATKSNIVNDKKLSIQIPSGIKLEINCVSSDIKAESLNLETFNLSTVSGKLTVNELKVSGDVKISSISGVISISKVTAPLLDIDTVSGNINADLVDVNKVDIDATSAVITLALNGQSYSLDFDSVSGKISKTGDSKQESNGKVELKIDTVTGNLTIK